MNENQYRFFFNQALFYARSISNEPLAAGRNIRAGRICRSCKSPLPKPHEPGSKLCEFCTDKHFVYMYFRRFQGWHCSFRTVDRKKLPKEFTFRVPSTLRELAKRGNGLIDKSDCDGFDLALEMGQGGVWLRLSDNQYKALGGAV